MSLKHQSHLIMLVFVIHIDILTAFWEAQSCRYNMSTSVAGCGGSVCRVCGSVFMPTFLGFCPAVCSFRRNQLGGTWLPVRKCTCDAHPSDSVCTILLYRMQSIPLSISFSFTLQCCHGDPSLTAILQWPPLTLVGDLWHLGRGQGQKVSVGRGATRALPRLALTCLLPPSSAVLTPPLLVCTSL